jgi:hypothetical protein
MMHKSSHKVEEQFHELFGSKKRKKAKAALTAAQQKAAQDEAMRQSAMANMAQSQAPDGSPNVEAPKKPNYMLYGGIALVLVIGTLVVIKMQK